MILLLACTEVDVPAAGTRARPSASVVVVPASIDDVDATPAALDFGGVEEGCSGVASLELRNEGDELRTCAVLVTEAAFSAAEVDVAIRPRSARSLAVRFAPADVGTHAGKLEFDCGAEVETVALAGDGVAREVLSVRWTQATPVVADIVLVIDGTASMSEEQASAVAGAYDLAHDAAPTQRLYVLGYGTTTLSGPVVGAGVTAHHVDALIPGSDSHAGLDTVLGTWGAIEAARRPEAELHLVFVGDSNDQSELRPEAFIATVPGVVVHGVAGDLPAGCDAATPNEPISALAATTGGEYLSICDVQWGEDLAGSFSNALETRFELDGIPVEGTLVVTVDGVEVGGWSYADADNQVVFETPPPAGALIEATYEISSC